MIPNGEPYRSISTRRVTLRDDGVRKNVRFRPGDRILGRYTVSSELGQGGMGIVYKCRDEVGKVDVAVKGLPPEVSHNSSEMEGILENYQLVRVLRHPNIAGVTSLEQDAETRDYYLVMDMAPGVSLEQWRMRNRNATLPEKLSILRQVADALDYAHGCGVMHRDVKTENIMVDESGHVSVLDFGLAERIRTSLSRVSMAVTSRSGTPGYKSPEQWRAQPQGAAADIYALGVLAYLFLAGHLPFDSDDTEILRLAVLNDPVPSVAGVSARINDALRRALAKRPEERFASCDDFVSALEGGGSRFGVAMKGILAAVLVTAFAGGAWWLMSGRNEAAETLPPDVARPAPATPVEAQPAVVAKSVAEPLNSRTFALPGGVEMEMIYVEPGTFMMGSHSGDDGGTPHQVKITKPYWIGKYPVTQRQWKALVKTHRLSFADGEPIPYFSRDGKGRDSVSGMDTSDFPMENISWDDCTNLVAALNRNASDGRTYSLPAEAMWEFAAKGGTKSRDYAYSGGDDLDALGWYYENSGERRLSDSDWKAENLSSNRCRTHSVTEKDVGNELGIVGMSGNVSEWCLDLYDKDYYAKSPSVDPCNTASGTSRVLRGGGWCNLSRFCLSANRFWNHPSGRTGYFGFRLCCSAGLGTATNKYPNLHWVPGRYERNPHTGLNEWMPRHYSH